MEEFNWISPIYIFSIGPIKSVIVGSQALSRFVVFSVSKEWFCRTFHIKISLFLPPSESRQPFFLTWMPLSSF